ncbi:MAG: type II toxin-antitoxin system VapC family toxin [Sphingomonadaceae bacterium]|nr:type II toxin-antitoxin system VapC family toxin [Sphingomonadaceae bacterium]
MTEPQALLDTNICIYLLEGLSDRARKRVEACVPGAVVTSAICYAELIRGLDPADRKSLELVERFFRIVPVLEFDRNAADAVAKVPFHRHRFDHLIAAHALALGLVLVTNNEADFADVPGLTVENWTV